MTREEAQRRREEEKENKREALGGRKEGRKEAKDEEDRTGVEFIRQSVWKGWLVGCNIT